MSRTSPLALLCLATQGTAYPSLSEINLVLENTQNRVENASLAIPSEAMMLPDG